MIKKKISIIIITLVIALLPLVANAGDYTSTDPNKNSSYNRTNAKNYAINYGPKFTTPYEGTGSGTSNGQYYNFYAEGGDCTNFVSQVLKAGGMGCLGTNRDYSSSWFYRGTYPNYSGTWTDAHNFRGHWGNINNSGSNRAYSYRVYTVSSALQNWPAIYAYMWEGDVVQHADSSGNTTHSQVIHGWSSGDYLYFAQHSVSSGGFYKDGNLKDYLNGRPSNAYFFTYQIKKGA